MKRQRLSITVIDRRHDPPKQTEHHFDKHKAYLKKMAALMGDDPSVHVDEETLSVITIYPMLQGSLFEEVSPA